MVPAHQQDSSIRVQHQKRYIEKALVYNTRAFKILDGNKQVLHSAKVC